MIAQGGGGKIVNTASIAGRQGYGNIVPYCASKFAVISITQSSARALAANKITVNAFGPVWWILPCGISSTASTWNWVKLTNRAKR